MGIVNLKDLSHAPLGEGVFGIYVPVDYQVIIEIVVFGFL